MPAANWAQLPVDMSVPAVRGGFQLSMVLRSNLESGSQGSEEEEEEEDGGSISALEPGQAGGSPARRGGCPWCGGWLGWVSQGAGGS